MLWLEEGAEGKETRGRASVGLVWSPEKGLGERWKGPSQGRE